MAFHSFEARFGPWDSPKPPLKPCWSHLISLGATVLRNRRSEDLFPFLRVALWFALGSLWCLTFLNITLNYRPKFLFRFILLSNLLFMKRPTTFLSSLISNFRLEPYFCQYWRLDLEMASLFSSIKFLFWGWISYPQAYQRNS